MIGSTFPSARAVRRRVLDAVLLLNRHDAARRLMRLPYLAAGRALARGVRGCPHLVAAYVMRPLVSERTVYGASDLDPLFVIDSPGPAAQRAAARELWRALDRVHAIFPMVERSDAAVPIFERRELGRRGMGDLSLTFSALYPVDDWVLLHGEDVRAELPAGEQGSVVAAELVDFMRKHVLLPLLVDTVPAVGAVMLGRAVKVMRALLAYREGSPVPRLGEVELLARLAPEPGRLQETLGALARQPYARLGPTERTAIGLELAHGLLRLLDDTVAAGGWAEAATVPWAADGRTDTLYPPEIITRAERLAERCPYLSAVFLLRSGADMGPRLRPAYRVYAIFDPRRPLEELERLLTTVRELAGPAEARRWQVVPPHALVGAAASPTQPHPFWPELVAAAAKVVHGRAMLERLPCPTPAERSRAMVARSHLLTGRLSRARFLTATGPAVAQVLEFVWETLAYEVFLADGRCLVDRDDIVAAHAALWRDRGEPAAHWDRLLRRCAYDTMTPSELDRLHDGWSRSLDNVANALGQAHSTSNSNPCS